MKIRYILSVFIVTIFLANVGWAGDYKIYINANGVLKEIWMDDSSKNILKFSKKFNKNDTIRLTIMKDPDNADDPKIENYRFFSEVSVKKIQYEGPPVFKGSLLDESDEIRTNIIANEIKLNIALKDNLVRFKESCKKLRGSDAKKTNCNLIEDCELPEININKDKLSKVPEKVNEIFKLLKINDESDAQKEKSNLKFDMMQKDRRILKESGAQLLRISKELKEIDKSRNQFEKIMKLAKEEPKTFNITINLDRTGSRYNTKIYRYLPEDYNNKRKEGVAVFAKDFKTFSRYYFGANIGMFIPLTKRYDYELKPIPDFGNPAPFNGTYSFITKTMKKDYNAVLFGSIYPFGFEPERILKSNFITWNDYLVSFFKNCYRLININLGFELSKNIFNKMYVGAGLSFGLFSVNFMACYGKLHDVGFLLGANQLVPNMVGIFPLIKEKYTWSYGLAVTIPIDFAVSWLALSLK